jgi:hypothetical protein
MKRGIVVVDVNKEDQKTNTTQTTTQIKVQAKEKHPITKEFQTTKKEVLQIITKKTQTTTQITKVPAKEKHPITKNQTKADQAKREIIQVVHHKKKDSRFQVSYLAEYQGYLNN